MKKLLNTLYNTAENRYLALDGLNIVVREDDREVGRVPLHNLESVITVGYTGVSPALMAECAEQNISICFLKPGGKFMARVTGRTRGNVVLRKTQYRYSEDPEKSLDIAVNFIVGKLYNSKWVLERTKRDYALRVDTEKLSACSAQLSAFINMARSCESLEALRGIEGEAASIYFSAFNEMILQQKEDFSFELRNRRPPTDYVNALLSLTYTLLANMCASAAETVGLDPYVGFLHRDRPGRASFALDMMEELRSVFADRFVLNIINKKIISAQDFKQKENGAVHLNDSGIKKYFTALQNKKKEELTHPFLNEKIEWGMVPYAQALLFSRYLRGDLDKYPPFLWK